MRMNKREGMWIAAWVLAATTASALVNPGLQPAHLVDRYRAVVALRVTEFSDEGSAATLVATHVLKGEFGSAAVTLRPEGEAAVEAFNTVLSPEQTVIAFVGKARRRGAEEFLLYLGGGRWGSGEVEPADGTAVWRWMEDLDPNGPRSLFGTFNGRPDRLAELVADVVAGTALFPAEPFTRFGPDRELSRLSATVSGIALEDFDGDQRLDVLAVSRQGARLLLQTVPGVFDDRTEPHGLASAGGPGVDVADADGDGRPDLLLGGTLWLAAKEGYRRSDRLPPEAADGIHQACFADLDADGYPDVLLALTDGRIRAFLNPGEAGGAFRDSTTGQGLDTAAPATGAPGLLCWGDWDGDGRIDLFHAVGKGRLLVQDAAGRFAPVRSRLAFEFTTEGAARGHTGGGVLAALWRPDSVDLAVANEANVYLAIREEGRLVDAAPYANEITEGVLGLAAVLAEDLNADGRLDLYAVNGGGGANVFYLNRGHGSFMTPHKYQPGLFAGPAHGRGGWAAAAGDLDGDGASDLVLGGLDGAVTLVPNATLALRGRTEHPTGQQRALDALSLLTVRMIGPRGVRGAQLTLADADGRTVARRVVGTQAAPNCGGPSAATLAVRGPGTYALSVRYADGLRHTAELVVPAVRTRLRATCTREGTSMDGSKPLTPVDQAPAAEQAGSCPRVGVPQS